MAGSPYLNLGCLVLWRKHLIPIMQPRLPPIRAAIKREASEMRQAPRMALFLSMPIMVNPTIFTITR